METLDLIIAGIISIGAASGFIKGGLKQFAGIVGLIVGLLLARAMYVALGEKLAAELGTSVTIAQIISFLMIWIIVPLVLSLLASALTKVIEFIHLGIINRLLGAILGAAKFALVISLLAGFVEYIDDKDQLVSKEIKEKSTLYYPVKGLLDWCIPVARDMTDDLLEKV